MKSLRYRHRQAELMDDPLLDDQTHRRALTGLRRVNWWSRTDAAVWQALQAAAVFAHSLNNGEPLRILDIASGGGDLAIRLARRFYTAGIPVVIDGCDISLLAAGLRQPWLLRPLHLACRWFPSIGKTVVSRAGNTSGTREFC